MAGTRGASTIFPWASASEWQQVYHDLFSGDTARMRRSCAHILSWTARSTSAMAFPIESTSDIVECLLLQQTLAAQSLCSDHVLRLAYAMAVNRLVACTWCYTMVFIFYVSAVAIYVGKRMALFWLLLRANVSQGRRCSRWPKCHMFQAKCYSGRFALSFLVRQKDSCRCPFTYKP